MFIPKIGMTEKELFINLLDTDDDVNLVLAAFNDYSRKGSLTFKKIRIRKLLNKKTASGQSPFDILMDKCKVSQLEIDSLDVTLHRFLSAENALPEFIQYLVLKRFFAPFLEENYEKICENILQGEPLIYQLTTFKTAAEAEDFYLRGREKVQKETLEEEVLNIREKFEEDVANLDEVRTLLKGSDLLAYERLLQTYEGIEKINILHDVDLEITTHEDSLHFLCSELAVMLAFLDVGEMSDEVRSKLLSETCIKYLKVKVLINTIKHDAKNEELLRRHQHGQKELREVSVQLKLAKKEREEAVKNVRETSEKLQKTMQQNQERESNVFQERYEKLQERLKEKQDQIQLVQKMKDSAVKRLTDELHHYRALSKGYKWGLSTEYFVQKVTVIHDAQLLYAPFVYPDVEFMSVEEALSKKLNARQLLVQYYGLSTKRKREIERLARNNACEVTSLMSRDEREMIIDIAMFLKQADTI